MSLSFDISFWSLLVRELKFIKGSGTLHDIVGDDEGEGWMI